MTINFGKFEYDHGENTFRAYAEIESAASRLAERLADHEEQRFRAIFEEAFRAGINFAKGGPDFDEWLDGFITKHREV